jgi:L-iditol 2-dehydrogenase
MKMLAAVWTDYGKIELQDVPVPEIADHEVLLKVRAAGVCTTDLEVYTGQFTYGKPPHILGHEIAGEVVRTGARADQWKPGDRVVVETSIGCGKCRRCQNGNRHLCGAMTEIGFTPHNGGYAQYVKAPGTNLFRIPDNVSYDEAGIIESVVCPMGALMRLGVGMGETVAVYGVGPAGIAFIQGAVAMGAGKIIAIGRNEDRLKRVRPFGADVLINSAKEDVRIRISEETGGAGADLVCEAAGSEDTIAAAFNTVCRGGRIILYGIPPEERLIPMPVINIITNQIEVYGTVGNPHVWEPLLQLVSRGRVNLKDMVSGAMPLSRITEAFSMLNKEDKPIKMVVHPWDE